MYFPLSELHGWDKRFAAQPQTIYSEIPIYVIRMSLWTSPIRIAACVRGSAA